MNENAAFVRVYHRSGLQVTIPLPVDGEPLSIDAAAALLASVDNLLAAGWLVNAPGIEDGELVEEIGWVVYKAKLNNDGTETPRMYLYPANDKLVYPTVSVYLNTPEDIAAFEAVSGLKLADMQLYEPKDNLKRGENPRLAKYFARAARPFKVVYKKNPQFNPDEPDIEKRKPQYVFVRWHDATPTPPPAGKVATFPGSPAAKQTGAPGTQVTTTGARTERKLLTESEWKSIVKKAVEEYGLKNDEVLPALANVVSYPVTVGSQWQEGDVNALAALLAYKAGYNSDLLKDAHPSVKPGLLLYDAAMAYIKFYQQKESA